MPKMFKSRQLKKQLSLLDVYAISTGAMFSSGFFLLPGLAAARAGPAVILSYFLSGILILPALFSMAELATAMPRAGGTYYFTSRSMGPLIGTIDGIGIWLAMSLKSAFALVGIGAYLVLFARLPMKPVALALCIGFTVMNILGAKETSRLQVILVAGLLGLLTYFVGKGIFCVDTSQFTPFAPFGGGSVLATAGFVFVSYIGLTKIASVSEEIQNPERNIPLGMILSLLTAMVVYTIGVLIIVSVLPSEQLHHNLTPVATAAGVFLGPIGIILMSIAAILAFATTANAGIMSASRYLLAMGRDKVLPDGLGRVGRSHTPRNAILLTSGVVILIIVFLDVEGIAKLASTFQILVFAFINLAVIVMRESHIKSYDPGFRSPGYPWVQIAGILIAFILIPMMGTIPIVFAGGLILIGVLWYFLYARPRVKYSKAITHVAERVAERLLRRDATSLGLDRELRQILKEKGLRTGDQFEKIVIRAPIIDLKAEQKWDELVIQASKLLGTRFKSRENEIRRELLARSGPGETPAEAGIALPHVLLHGIDSYELVLARSRQGLWFPGTKLPVYSIFILVGSRDNPRQHLRFLAELAKRADAPEFMTKWLKADSPDEIRATLLRSKGKS
ncbi:amino acid permease [candidate division WOR-3 bacterium]|nr:amino acid permease [candidate division WOR-3 bacterium]